jgi:uroporphyrinogen-III synthase
VSYNNYDLEKTISKFSKFKVTSETIKQFPNSSHVQVLVCRQYTTLEPGYDPHDRSYTAYHEETIIFCFTSPDDEMLRFFLEELKYNGAQFVFYKAEAPGKLMTSLNIEF